jgi:hypothetical protein
VDGPPRPWLPGRDTLGSRELRGGSRSLQNGHNLLKQYRTFFAPVCKISERNQCLNRDSDSVNLGSNPGPQPNLAFRRIGRAYPSPRAAMAWFHQQIKRLAERGRQPVRRLLTLHHNGPVTASGAVAEVVGI